MLFASFFGKLKATTSTQCRCEYWMRKIFAKGHTGFWYLFSPFSVLSSQSRNGIPHKAEKKIDMAINIYIFSLPFHCKIIIEQISYKHLGMKWWTKPTRARCHGDYIWNTENFFIYTFIFVIDIIWISSLLLQHPYSQKSYTSYN